MRLDNRGNVALLFALFAPLLLGAAGAGIDFQRWHTQTTKAQQAVDELATRGAREFLLKNATDIQVKSVVEATAESHYMPEIGAFKLSVTTNRDDKSVNVEIFQPAQKSYFLKSFEPFKSGVFASATAVARGVTNVCVIALEGDANDAIRGEAMANMSAPECAILSDSTAQAGINILGLSKLEADLICSAGGVRGGSSNFSQTPLTDCPAYGDPLASRVAPAVGACDHTDLVLGDHQYLVSRPIAADLASTPTGYDRFDLEPGVYCGGIQIRANADVHFAPGEYIIKDGPLTVDLGGRLYGENVGFYLDGADALFTFNADSNIHLTAPKSGLMAGLLFFEDRTAPEGRTHSILSGNAHTMLGTFYLPRGDLEVASIAPLADKSAYTAIVARRLRLRGAPTLVLNADYNSTDIPTPDGMGPTGGQIYLRE